MIRICIDLKLNFAFLCMTPMPPGLIPLYITVQQHKGEVVLLVDQAWYFWFTKYEFLIRHLSNYAPVLIGRDTYIHCFADVTVGLKIHGDLVIDTAKMRDGKGMKEFQVRMGDG